MQKYTGELTNYPFTIRTQVSHKKGESDNKRIFCEDIFTFDIETTSFFYGDDNVPFIYHTGEDPDYWNEVDAGGIPYIWQFGINNTYYYGRDFDDFYALLDDFPDNMKVRIFIHNLSFEWHWMDRLTWDKVFARTPHKPMKASCKEFPNIEFLCSYTLENMSLADWGDELGIPKLMGKLDYNKELRTPLTPLSEDEMAYAERDLEVMYVGLKKELETYNSVWNLPLTSTGKIRRVVKPMLMEDDKYRNFIKTLIPENAYALHTSEWCYAGGYTHANRCFVNYTVTFPEGESGGHYDFTSSYPTEMVLAKVPMTAWEYVDKKIPPRSRFKDYAYKMHLRFRNIRCQLQNTYISFSQCSNTHNIKLDNGRVISGDIDLWCTEQDFEIIEATYIWDTVEALEIWEAEKDYLPKKFVEYVLELFDLKANNSKYKPFVNGLYGMSVTSVLMGDIEWHDDEGVWETHRINDTMIEEHLEKIRRFRDSRYFLNYDWGVWISNGSRCRLWKDCIIPYDKHIIYADTDSIFADIQIDFTAYNKSVDRKMKKVCDERGLDYEKTRPYSKKKGKRTPLGHLTTEPNFTEFRTMGAKRYIERWEKDGQLHLTISGVPKSAVTLLKDDIENFRDGFIFDKDEEDMSKLMHTYFYDQPDITFPDGYVSHQRRGVNLRPNSYKLSLNKTFKDMLKDIEEETMNDAFITHMRGVARKD